MTRTEAIEIIKREFSMDEDVEKLYPEVVEAREMAISALEQDCDKCEYANPCLYCKHEFSLTSTDEPMTMVYPTIFCEDAISREAVEGLMTNWMFFSPSHKAEAEKELSELPSVQPSRKGHWIVGSDTDIKGETVYWFTCSECKSDRGQHTNYCPDCGAKMDNTCEVINDSTDIDKQ